MSDRGEQLQLFAAAFRVGSAGIVFGFLLGIYLFDSGKIGTLGWLLVTLLTGAAGFALGGAMHLLSGKASERLVRTITAAGNLAPTASFSQQESLVARGRLEEARRSYEAHLAAHPADLDAKLALARLWRDHLGDPARAEQLYLAARQQHPGSAHEFAIGNGLIDLYRATGQRGRELAELARFAERFAGTDAGERARSALARLKEAAEG